MVLFVYKPYLQRLGTELRPSCLSWQTLYWQNHIPLTNTHQFKKKCWNLSGLCRQFSPLAKAYLKQRILWIANQTAHSVSVSLSSITFVVLHWRWRRWRLIWRAQLCIESGNEGTQYSTFDFIQFRALRNRRPRLKSGSLNCLLK